jgi:hypothetical protein
MEATYSSVTSVDLQRTALRYIPEDRSLHNQCVAEVDRLGRSEQRLHILLQDSDRIIFRQITADVCFCAWALLASYQKTICLVDKRKLFRSYISTTS